MATPRNNAYTGTAGATLYAGQAKPQWHASAPSGSWVELPNSTFSTSGVGFPGGRTIAGFSTNFDHTALVRAWSGGVLNTVGVKHDGAFIPGAFLVLFGGGHGDYAGNELYAYGPLQSAPVWRRLNDPTVPPPNDIRRDGSGNPVSRHTYDSLVYMPAVNKMVCFGSPASFALANDKGGANVFDFATNTWQQQDTGYGTGGDMINCVSGYDHVNNRAIVLGKGNSNKLAAYSPLSGSWVTRSKDNPLGGSDQKGSVSSSLQILVYVTSSAQVVVLDLTDFSQPTYVASTTGTPPASREGRITCEWHDGYGCFIFFDEDRKTYRLTPGANPKTDVWTWTSHAHTGSEVPAFSGDVLGTFGRWRRVPASGDLPPGMILMRRHDTPILFLKD